MKKPLKISFEEWIKVVLKNDARAVKQVLCMVALEIIVFIMACKYSAWPNTMVLMQMVLLATALGIGMGFLVALIGAWKKACKNPPWYLIEHCREAGKFTGKQTAKIEKDFVEDGKHGGANHD